MNDFYRDMTAATLLLLGLAFAGWQVWRRPPSLERVQRGFATVHGAYLDPSFLSPLHAMSRRSRRLSALSTLAMATGGAILVWQTDLAPILVVASVLSVSLVLDSAQRLADAGREFVVLDSRSAVARPRRVVLSDYVPPGAQLLTWVSVTVVVIGSAAILREHAEIGRPATILVATGATAIVAEAAFAAWFGKVLCDRPTPAVDASHLYLQDAWRASALEGVHFQLRLCAVLFTLAIPMSSPDLGFGLGIGLVASGLAIHLAAKALPPRHFRARLWHTLQPGQVLLPGQPVPPRVGAPA
jgi:hypothetical protein